MRNITNIQFSLIIPTRNRMQFLKRCLESFFEKAVNKDRVEAIIMADFDDRTMRNFEEYVFPNNYNIKIIFQRQSHFMIRDYNNYGSQCSTGKYVWILNDDVEMATERWDEIISHKCETYLADKPDRIVYVQMDDSTHTHKGTDDILGCCFPILSKEAVDIQNGIMPKEIACWGADVWQYKIFTRLSKNRILNITKNVKLLHHCRHNGTVSPDSVADHVERVSSVGGELTRAQLNHYVHLFSRYL